jgi:alpha-N-arabinofuranosidase
LIDEHFYRRPEEFFDDTHHYDKYDRNGPKIFVGEWATREGTPTPDMGATLADAAWMTGMERNSDIVLMAAYAPLLVNVDPGGMQWDTDLIGYNTLQTYGSPSYWAQVMFSNHTGDQVLHSNVDGGGPRFFYSITKDSSAGVLYLKLVNADSVRQSVSINLSGAKTVGASGRQISLSAATTDETNNITDQRKIVPVTTALDNVGAKFRHTLPPRSIQILEVHVQ